MAEEPLHSDLWHFMERIYAAPGVATACLRLQDRNGVDVPLLLASIYAAGTGCPVGSEEVQRFDRICADWRREVIHPLRRVRRRMKQSEWMQTLEPAPEFRENVKRLELRGEQIQVLMLWQAIEELSRGSSDPKGDGTAYRRAAGAVVAHFYGAAPESGALEDIETLACAATALTGL